MPIDGELSDAERGRTLVFVRTKRGADRLVRNLQARMKPGGALQLWALEIDFKTIKQRQWMTVGHQSYGHSPIFHHNGSDARGPIVHVFDQFGVTSSRVLIHQDDGSAAITASPTAAEPDKRGRARMIRRM